MPVAVMFALVAFDPIDADDQSPLLAIADVEEPSVKAGRLLVKVGVPPSQIDVRPRR